MITKKRMEVELKFTGSGNVEEKRPGYFVGGVPHPKLSGNIGFTVHRQIPDDDGVLNPVLDEGPFLGSIQLNLFGTSKGFRELGKYFLALSELNTKNDPCFHQHHDDLMSIDGLSHVHLIVHKQYI